MVVLVVVPQPKREGQPLAFRRQHFVIHLLREEHYDATGGRGNVPLATARPRIVHAQLAGACGLVRQIEQDREHSWDVAPLVAVKMAAIECARRVRGAHECLRHAKRDLEALRQLRRQGVE